MTGQRPTLSTYFNVHEIGKDNSFIWQGITFQLIPVIHVYNDDVLMPCYGLFFEYNGKRIFFTSDTQYTPDNLSVFYEQADIIFHDCETSITPSGVHAHYTQLVTLPLHLKKKLWLYHYAPGPRSDAVKDGFLGFVARGQVFTF